MLARFFALTLITVGIGSAQSQTFDFTNKPSPQGLQEIAAILRTVCGIRQVSIDSTFSTINVQGTPDELSMSGWIVHNLDQPANAPAASPAPFLVSGKNEDIIRIFHLTHISDSSPQGIQAILTAVRTIADIQKVFNYTALTDLVVRGTSDEIAFAEYLVNALDIVPGAVTSSAEFHFAVRTGVFRQTILRTDTAHIFYLAHTANQQGLQEILTTLRTVTEIQRVFNVNSLPALAVRGSAADITAAEWIIQSLDTVAYTNIQPSGIREFNMQDGGAIRVFYPPVNTMGNELSQMMRLVRIELPNIHVFFKSVPPAVIIRGTAEQIGKADSVLRSNYKSVSAKP